MIPVHRCRACGAEWFNPALRCQRCGSEQLIDVDVESEGEVRSYSEVHSDARSPTPWGLAEVETDGGVRLIGPTEERLEIGGHAVVLRLEEGVPVFARRT